MGGLIWGLDIVGNVPTPAQIRWEVMSSSHLTNNKIVEFPLNGPQTESSEPNEQFIAMLVNEPRNS